LNLSSVFLVQILKYLNFSIEDILRFSFLIPIFLFYSTKRENRKDRLVLLYYPICSFVHALIYAFLLIYSTQRIAFLFNALFIPIEFLTVSFFFFKSIKYDFHKKSLWIVFIAFCLFFIIETIYNPTEKFDSLINAIESTFFIFYSLVFFYENIKYPKNLFIYKQPFFWGAAAFFLFYSITFFAFIYRQTFWYNKDLV
jgi:hypothetical protein